MSRDPIGYEGGDISLYPCCGSRPITHTDPTGKVSWLWPPNWWKPSPPSTPPATPPDAGPDRGDECCDDDASQEALDRLARIFAARGAGQAARLPGQSATYARFARYALLLSQARNSCARVDVIAGKAEAFLNDLDYSSCMAFCISMVSEVPTLSGYAYFGCNRDCAPFINY